MFIEDDELRALYKASSAEHLETIESGLMHLEKHPNDGDQLNAVLRAMHSLKGDSRMLGVNDAEKVVHHMEDLLIEVQQGNITLTPGLCDRLYKGLDATQKLADEAVGGEPVTQNLFFVLAALMADAADSETSASPLEPTLLTEETSALSLDELPGLEEVDILEQARLQLEQQVPDPPVPDSPVPNPLLPNPAIPDSASFLASSNISDSDLDALLGLEEDMDVGEEDDLETLLADSDDDDLTTLLADSDDDDLTTLLADSDDDAIAEPKPKTPATAETTTPSAAKSNKQYQIDSVRVEASKLDLLMNQADELTVTKLGIARRQEDLDAIYSLWQDWSRELSLLQINGASAKTDGLSQQAFLRVTQERLTQMGEALVNMRHATNNDFTRLEAVSQSLESGIRNLRLLPLSSMFTVFPRLVRDLSRAQGKSIELVVEGGNTLVDKRILEELKDPLTHLIRNAIDHGIETLDDRLAHGKTEKATIRLRGFQAGDRIGIELIDDGQGLDVQKIQRTALRKGLHSEAELETMSAAQIQNLIFAPGFSTKTTVTAISGRGVGLDVVRSNVQRLKGTLEVESTPGEGCQFRLLINANLASTHALIVEVQDEVYAIPIDAVETLLLLERDELFTFDGKLTIRWQEQPTAVQWLADLLNVESLMPHAPPTSTQLGKKIPCVMLKLNGVYLGLLVDQLVDQEHLVLKAKSQVLSQVPNVRGSAILGSGDICMILEPVDLLQSAQGELPLATTFQELLEDEASPKILLVEDSMVIRTQMTRILSGAGFDVTAAVDGLDGLDKLDAADYQAIVSDVEMPNLSGLEMTQAIRQSQDYQDLPIILVTTLADEDDRQRGTDAGANAYLTKGDFDQTLLLNTLRRLI